MTELPKWLKWTCGECGASNIAETDIGYGGASYHASPHWCSECEAFFMVEYSNKEECQGSAVFHTVPGEPVEEWLM